MVFVPEKTPMCLINELARHNKTTHMYRLTDETGEFISWSVCLSFSLSVCLFVYPSVCLSVCLSVYLYDFMHVSRSLLFCLSFYHVSVSVCFYCKFVCCSVCVSMFILIPFSNNMT